jgi:hypothetical protein
LVDDPEVGREIHPAIRDFPTKNVKTDGTFTVAEMVLLSRITAVFTLPEIDRLEKTGTVVL